LIGNVDTIDLLAKGTPQQIENYVKKEIKVIGPGGGLIIASSHSINPAITFENYRTMIETAKKYGKYPIKIEN
ncbi:MAG: uroporphyrinogen decarboxylase family protein, partial [Candidatus Helarchaeota archaeon]